MGKSVLRHRKNLFFKRRAAVGEVEFGLLRLRASLSSFISSLSSHEVAGPPSYRKGIRLIFLNRTCRSMVVTLTEPREAGGVPGKSSLFFFTVTRLFSCQPSRRFFFFFFCSFSAVSRKGGGGRRVKEKGEGLLTLLGWLIVLASLESGYLEKGNDDW